MKNRRLLRSIVVWLLSVLVFSGVYLFLWRVYPDSFILHKEFNLTPYQELNASLWAASTSSRWGDAAASRPAWSQDIDEFSRSAAKLDSDARSTLALLQRHAAAQQRLEEDMRIATKIQSDVMWSNVDRYKAKTLAPEEATERTAAERLARLEQLFGPNPNPQQSVQIADARVATAHASYGTAVKRAEVADYVLRNLGAFSEPEARVAVASIADSLREITSRQGELDKKLGEIRAQAYEALRQWYVARQARLDWIDFVYFSVGVSTTTTFGDIVPNSRIARVAVLVQLVVSVLVVGYLVSVLTAPKVFGAP